jgi:hypothetical protein
MIIAARINGNALRENTEKSPPNDRPTDSTAEALGAPFGRASPFIRQEPPPPCCDRTATAHLPTAHLPTAHLPTAHLPTAHLPTAHLPTAHLPTAYPPTANRHRNCRSRNATSSRLDTY